MTSNELNEHITNLLEYLRFRSTQPTHFSTMREVEDSAFENLEYVEAHGGAVRLMTELHLFIELAKTELPAMKILAAAQLNNLDLHKAYNERRTAREKGAVDVAAFN